LSIDAVYSIWELEGVHSAKWQQCMQTTSGVRVRYDYLERFCVM
jgi:hypothetical protein